jgi:hypothetical protein
MSADNTVIVLSTPAYAGSASDVGRPSERVYRVAEVQAAESLTCESSTPEYLNWILVENFGKSPLYFVEAEAWRAALALADEMEASERYLEYGVQSVALDLAFPSRSAAQLRLVLKQKRQFPFDR